MPARYMGYALEDKSPDFHWYALWTRSRQEKIASTLLGTMLIPNFLPLKTEVRQWSDRKQAVTVPLFSGYLFVRSSLESADRLRILQTQGIAGFVGNSSGPLSIPDTQIDSIHRLLSCELGYSVHPLLHVGTRVRILRGPLCGIEGTLLYVNSTMRLLISIETIHRTISVSVSKQDIEPIPSPDADHCNSDDHASRPGRIGALRAHPATPPFSDYDRI